MASSAIDEARRNTDAAYLQELQEQNAVLSGAVETLEERMADVVNALDNIGWNPMGVDFDPTEIPLSTILEVSRTTRALHAINPLIKRGMSVRCAYIWGEGVEFKGIPETDPLLTTSSNWKSVFSPQAQVEMENMLGTDGQVFALLTKKGPGNPADKIQRLPLTQITGTVTDPDNHEDVWFYRREWDVTKEGPTGAPSTDRHIAYYPAADYDQQINGRPRMFRDYPVDYSAVILHKAVGKQVGWKWGTPDLMSVVFWSKAYKEFLENSASLVKAYARFAFKVTSPTKQGVGAAAAKVSTQPTRDPLTGQVSDVGATAVMGMGTTLSTIGKSGASVDFDAGLPLAAMVAAGLDIPLTTLTSDAGSANRSAAETLNDPTVKAMEARQKLWTDFYDQIFKYFGKSVTVKWPEIESEASYRQIQAIAQAAGLNMLSAKEIRQLLLIALDLDDSDPDTLPTKDDLGLLTLAMDQAAEQALQAKQAVANDQAAGSAQKPPGGNAAKPATAQPSYGDNGYRNDAGQHAYSQGKNG